MGLLIDIKKIEESEQDATYYFCTIPTGNSGKVAITKKTKEFFILEEPEWDKEHELAYRVGRVLIQHWKKGEFPDITCWAS